MGLVGFLNRVPGVKTPGYSHAGPDGTALETACKVADVMLVIRFWMKRKDIPIFGRMARSIVLLIPFFGLILCIPATAG